MADKPTEMCVVEKSGAREYKVMYSSFFRLPDESKRVVLEEALSSIAIALRLLVFSLSLCRRRRALSLSPSRRRRLEIEGGGRTTRAVGARVDDFVVGGSVVPKVGREETRAARKRLD